jgi:hypothetical protein
LISGDSAQKTGGKGQGRCSKSAGGDSRATMTGWSKLLAKWWILKGTVSVGGHGVMSHSDNILQDEVRARRFLTGAGRPVRPVTGARLRIPPSC